MSTNDMVQMVIDMYPEIAFQKLLDIKVVDAKLGQDNASVRLPFHEQLCGGGQAYHGGVISSLIDLTGALAAWCGHDASRGMKASTVTLNVHFLSAALGQDIIAKAQVKRRGKELNFVDIVVETADEARKLIATGTMVYRIA
jgi:uncharacterized protein (TIGR00369 family)